MRCLALLQHFNRIGVSCFVFYLIAQLVIFLRGWRYCIRPCRFLSIFQLTYFRQSLSNAISTSRPQHHCAPCQLTRHSWSFSMKNSINSERQTTESSQCGNGCVNKGYQLSVWIRDCWTRLVLNRSEYTHIGIKRTTRSSKDPLSPRFAILKP